MSSHAFFVCLLWKVQSSCAQGDIGFEQRFSNQINLNGWGLASGLFRGTGNRCGRGHIKRTQTKGIAGAGEFESAKLIAEVKPR
jgi:hypothetical protein